MRTIKFLLQKEFRQILRNKTIRGMIFIMPVVQLLIIPMAADYEVKNINFTVVDLDHSTMSEQMLKDVISSGYFKLAGYKSSYREAFKEIEKDNSDLILEIPAGFEKNLIRDGNGKLLLAINAINGVKANLGGVYLSTILKSFNEKILLRTTPASKAVSTPSIELTWNNRFNREMNYQVFMVPGILAILVTMVGGFLSALNIVKEKESGTIEQINVTPIRKHHFIIGKLIPFWLLGILIFTIGLVIARVAYGITPLGSLAVLYTCVSVYLLALLGFGLLISTFCETQQQAMLIMFFFMMIFILMGGLYTSIDSMPGWAKVISAINPVTYLIEAVRMVILKGSGLMDVMPHLFKLSIFTILLNLLAILNYRKTS